MSSTVLSWKVFFPSKDVLFYNEKDDIVIIWDALQSNRTLAFPNSPLFTNMY